jgi:predicted GNAT family acetyltransferase
MLDVVAHEDLARFWADTEAFYTADPVLHTVALTVISRRLNHPSSDGGQAAVCVTAYENGVLKGAALCTPPRPLIASGIPAHLADDFAAALLPVQPDLYGVSGHREAAEAFVRAWTARTGRRAKENIALRLHRLDTLLTPQVHGHLRLADERDIPLLGQWRQDFQDECLPSTPGPPDPADAIRRSIEAGNANAVWEVDGVPVSWAVANAPIQGMSRIGPVFTPPAHRNHGYAAAVTAAVSQWAQDAGASEVLLYTDLANPTSNGVYRRIGFVALFDATEMSFTDG